MDSLTPVEGLIKKKLEQFRRRLAQVKINGSSKEMLSYAVEQFGGKPVN